MQTETLKERVAIQKAELEELAKTAETTKNCGRDSESLTPQHDNSMNRQEGWDKGWNNYGKT